MNNIIKKRGDLVNKLLLRWQIAGMIFIFVLGALWHFIYQWSGNSYVIGLIAPVNESVWEHLKMVLFPSLIFAAIEYRYIKDDAQNFITAITISIITAMVLIVVTDYAYTSILGDNVLIVDIFLFAVSIIAGQSIGYKILTSESYPKWISYLSLVILVLIITAFIIFTINPPRLQIFMDPNDMHYGI